MSIVQALIGSIVSSTAGGGGGGGGGYPSPGAGFFQASWPDSAGWSAQVWYSIQDLAQAA